MKTTVGGVLAFAITLLVSLPSTLAVPAVPQGPGPTPTDLPDPSSPTTARYSLLIDDMENVTDWLALGPNISLSSDRTQGNYSLNMSGLTNGSFYLAAKNITAMGIDATRYDALEFDLKVSKKEYAIFLAGFDDPPAYDRAGWYRTYRDAGVWHHAVLPFAEQQRALGGAKIGEEYALFLFAGHPDFGSKPVWFHVDNLKLTGSGLRITAPSYACADPSGNTAIAVKASHLLGGAAETLRLELDRTTLGPFRSSSPDIERFGVPVGGSFAANFSFEAPVDLPQDSSWKIAFNLTSTSDPAKRTRAEITLGTWTPLQRIYFLSDKDREENEIYSMNPDGTGIERLTNNTVYEHEPLSLSGDGRRLAFARKVTQNDQDFELWWINTTTRQEFRLTTNSTYEVHPDWSGDGKWLTFFGMQGIGKVRDDGTGYTLLSTSIAADPAFSRDSKRIAHNGWPGVVGDMKDVELYMMDADGKNRTRLTTNNLTETDPYWARDDSDFLFDRYNGFGQWNNLSHSIGEPWGIYRWDIASGKETELFNGTGPNWLPTYSPDNRRVSFLHQNETIGIHRLRFMDPDGSNLTELALPYHVMWHDWGVREPVQVDLAVRDLRITPSPPKANQTANLSVVVENRGKVATSATLQLFDGPRDDRYPSLLARIQLPPVAAGSSVNVTSPFVAAKGNRTSWARVESVGQWDIVPGNNVTRVDYEAAPPVTTLKDLAVLQGKLIVSPPSPDENSLISITTSVKNLGTANATGILRYYRGPPAPGNEIASPVSTGSLTSGSERAIASPTFRLPAGDQLLTVLVNSTGDANSSNDAATLTVKVSVVPPPPDLPDLVLDPGAAASPNPAKPGDKVTFGAKVRNAGKADSTATVVRAGNGTATIGETAVGALAPGAETQVQFEMDTTGKEGAQVVVLFVDPTNSTAESNESNNKVTVTFRVEKQVEQPPPPAAPQAEIPPAGIALCAVSIVLFAVALLMLIRRRKRARESKPPEFFAGQPGAQSSSAPSAAVEPLVPAAGSPAKDR